MERSPQHVPETQPEEELIRPEELIVEIYRQKTERTAAGLNGTQVIMSLANWRRIRAYHSSLGILKGSLPDYINDDTIFGLEVMIDNRDGVKVL
ncbi:MAG: hypothetical protein JXA95_10850 [Spirochaetales bacterium]|nr:hypothetical protein [Spirochaetales bacterium]